MRRAWIDLVLILFSYTTYLWSCRPMQSLSLTPSHFPPISLYLYIFFSPLPSFCSDTKQLAQTHKEALNYTALNSVTTQSHEWGSESPSVPGRP